MRLALAGILLAALLAATGTVASGFTTAASTPARFAAAPVFPPRLVEPPAISGVATDGETLTATRGVWARDPATVEVEWLRCAEACEPVASGDELELSPADVGKRMRVRVTATNGGGSAIATSAPTEVVAPLPPPVNDEPPAVAGTPSVGHALTADDGAWSGRRLTSTRRWLRCTTTCSPIAGEGDATYLVTGDDAGATIRLEVEATNASGSVTATSPATAAVTRTAYTQLLCANPATGLGVAADGAPPDGIVVTGTMTHRYDPRPATRCAAGSTPNGVPLSAGGTYYTQTVGDRLVLEYRPAAATAFRGATLYRYGAMGGHFSWAITTSTSTALFATPRTELCSWGLGCTTRGSAADRFGAQNRVAITPGPDDGFNITLACDIPSGWRCDADGSQIVRLFGGRISLADTATPEVAAAGGGLLDGELEPVEDLDLTAGDAGSGLHRVIVTIDGREVATRRLHDNGGRCADHDPGTEDPFEFATRQPCVTSLAASLLFETAAWPRSGRLRVYLEDAGGNTTVVVNRIV